MDESTAIRALLVLLAFATMTTIWIFGIRPLINESARLEIFKVRDRLFDRFFDGELNCTLDEYRATRDLLNGYIRYLHQVDGVLLLLLLWASLKKEDLGEPPIVNDPHCAEAYKRGTRIVMLSAMLKSPVLLILVFVAVFIRLILEGVSGDGPFSGIRKKLMLAIENASKADDLRQPT